MEIKTTGATSKPAESVKTPISSTDEANKLLVGEPDGMEPLEKIEEAADMVEQKPEITDVKVYYGYSGEGEGRKPDPYAILYYEKPDGSVIDVANGTTLPSKPSVLQHLNQRPVSVEERDVVAAIIHGVMNDADFDMLEKAGLLADTPKALWSKVKMMKSYADELEGLSKSEDEELDEEDEDQEMEQEEFAEESEGDDVEQQAASNLQQMMDAARGQTGDKASISTLSEQSGLPSDLISQIMAAARAEASNSVRSIVQEVLAEELPKMIEYLLDDSSDQEQDEDVDVEFHPAELPEDEFDESTE